MHSKQGTLHKKLKFQLISWCGVWDDRAAKLWGTCAENFRTRKLGEILVFSARIGNFRNSFLKFEQ